MQAVVLNDWAIDIKLAPLQVYYPRGISAEVSYLELEHFHLKLPFSDPKQMSNCNDCINLFSPSGRWRMLQRLENFQMEVHRADI